MHRAAYMLRTWAKWALTSLSDKRLSGVLMKMLSLDDQQTQKGRGQMKTKERSFAPRGVHQRGRLESDGFRFCQKNITR